MAKRRTRRRFYRKGKWSSNIQDIQATITAPSGPDTFAGTTTLVTNPVQNSLTTSTIYTVKNIEATIELAAGLGSTIGDVNKIQYYIMYVPEGMNVDELYNIKHPEFIMNYRYIGEPESLINNNGPGRNLIKIRTRLARKLQTGDSIVLLIKGYNGSLNPNDIYVQGIVRWWTKSN